MRRAISLARRAYGYTYPNPLVGCVIVHENKIIGEGYHHQAGQPHAEVMALRQVENIELLKDAEVYVTLEPCSHYGRTPPCAEKLAALGVRKVFVGSLDPNPKVAGKGIRILEDADIEVITGVLEQECRRLNPSFLHYFEKERPYITLKWAESSDGFMDDNGKPTAISNSLINQLTHRERAFAQSMLIGRTTLERDRPRLNTRHYFGTDPAVIILDPYLKAIVPKDMILDSRKIYILNTIKTEISGQIEYCKIDFDDFKTSFYTFCQKHFIQNVMVEGGAFTLQKFIDLGMYDRVIKIINPNLTLNNGTKAPTFNKETSKIISVRDQWIKVYE